MDCLDPERRRRGPEQEGVVTISRRPVGVSLCRTSASASYCKRPCALSYLQPTKPSSDMLSFCERSNDLGGDVEEEDGGDEGEGQDNDDEWVTAG